MASSLASASHGASSLALPRPGGPSAPRKARGCAVLALASPSTPPTSDANDRDKAAFVENRDGFPLSKRALMANFGGLSVSSVFHLGPFHALEASAEEAPSKSNFTDMPALRGKDYGKSKMRYEDYVLTESGLQYKDLREGSGKIPERGQTVVIDWDGFTIGYYGRIFEARNKAKGGSFEGNEKDFYRFQVGANKVIPAFEEAIATMQVGGIRRIIVPPEIGYPENDFNKLGPKPTTFSGQRALDFVLKNQGLIDKTLLFDIELLRIVD